MGIEDDLLRMKALVGGWTTESTHPYFPGTIVHGTATVEWLEGERFLIWRRRMDHPDFPDSIAVIGHTDGLRLHYFDSRGVFRIYEFAVTDDGWEYARETPEFSQLCVARFDDDRNTMRAAGRMSRDGAPWEDDLQTTYRRN
jgi:hypothetical protein